ncbi:MAG TPA: ABC transporter [Ruminococcus sp.]|nr:ABC transporter [Ruminococcus sp.]
MIELCSVTKRFGNLAALDGISLKIGNGNVLGLVGSNGSGKSTMLRLISGVFEADEGEILIDGEDSFENTAAKGKVFFVSDYPYFYNDSTVKNTADLYKRLYTSWSDEKYSYLCSLFPIHQNQRIINMSKGMQRQAEIILAMATRPKYLFFDEVFDGIDPQKRNLCKKLFIEYMAETQCTILMSSHNLQEVADLCDHVALINGKNLTLDVSVDDASSAYKKYRLIFDRDVTVEDFSAITYKDLTIESRMVSVIVDSQIESKVFEALNPVHMDSVNLSLEEVFLNEMEDRKYDISSIFSE